MLGIVDGESVPNLPEDPQVSGPGEEGERPHVLGREEPRVGEEVVDQGEGDDHDDGQEHEVDAEIPVEDAGAAIEQVHDLEDDKLEEGAAQAQVDAEQELKVNMIKHQTSN